MTIVKELGRCVEQHSSNSSGREAGHSGVDTDDMDEFDSPGELFLPQQLHP